MILSLLLAILQSTNPYCNKTPDDFGSPFIPYCEGNMDQNCISQCIAEYKNGMVLAYDHACFAYDVEYGFYQQAMRSALDDYDSCLASATNTAERLECRSTFASRMQELNNTWSQDQAAISQMLDGDASLVWAAFDNCATSCCH